MIALPSKPEDPVIWTTFIFGYLMQLLAAPTLALANNWPNAAALIILERLSGACLSIDSCVYESRSVLKEVLVVKCDREQTSGTAMKLMPAITR